NVGWKPHRHFACCFPIVCTALNERLIDKVIFDQNVKQAIRECDVSAWFELQMQVALSCRRCFSWIDNDPASAVIALLPQKLVEYGKCLSAVRSGNQQNFRERNIAPWICCAIDTEGLVIPRSRRNHAKPAVVIDVTRAQSCARKLTHQVSL